MPGDPSDVDRPSRPASYVPLPAGLVDPRQTAGRVFDDFADEYDAARPTYPADALARIAGECDLGPGRRVLEVGCGTGQLTRPLAVLGCAVRCLEPGRRLAALARTNLASWPDVEVRTETFEEADEPRATYHAVVAATAFHWVDPGVGYAKAAAVLRAGGHLVLVTNAHVRGGTQEHIAEEARDLHRRLAPEVGVWAFPSVDDLRRRAEERGDVAAVWGRVERRLADPPDVGGLFEAPRVTVHPWTAHYDRDGYLAMLRTQSSYALLPEERRCALLEALGATIDARLGGAVSKQYACVVAIARARTG